MLPKTTRQSRGSKKGSTDEKNSVRVKMKKICPSRKTQTEDLIMKKDELNENGLAHKMDLQVSQSCLRRSIGGRYFMEIKGW